MVRVTQDQEWPWGRAPQGQVSDSGRTSASGPRQSSPPSHPAVGEPGEPRRTDRPPSLSALSTPPKRISRPNPTESAKNTSPDLQVISPPRRTIKLCQTRNTKLRMGLHRPPNGQLQMSFLNDAKVCQNLPKSTLMHQTARA